MMNYNQVRNAIFQDQLKLESKSLRKKIKKGSVVNNLGIIAVVLEDTFPNADAKVKIVVSPSNSDCEQGDVIRMRLYLHTDKGYIIYEDNN